MGDELSGGDLGFSFDMTGKDRHELLADAARTVGVFERNVHQSESFSVDQRAPIAEIIESIDRDQVEIHFPEVYRIRDQDFLSRGKKAPVALTDVTGRHDFYWIQFPLFLKNETNWTFHRLELEVLFEVDGPPHLAPRAWEVLPQKRFQTLAKWNMGVNLGLDEDLHFSEKVEAPLPGGGAGAGADLKSAAHLGLVAGPFQYVVKKARIDHSGMHTSRVFWKIDGADYLQEGAPDFVVVTQIPKDAHKKVKVTVTAQAYRAFNTWTADVQDVVRRLPDALAEFFKAGAPLPDRKVFADISAVL